MPTVIPSATTWAIVLLPALMSGLTTALGVVLAIRLGKKCSRHMAFVSALAEPAGALVGLVVVQLEPALNAFFIAVAAGAMIFVSVHELLPMAARFGNLPLFGASLALSVPVYILLRSIVTG